MYLKPFITTLITIMVISANASESTTTISETNIPQNITRTNSCIPGQPDTANSYNATKWYRDSAEKNAQYNQIFSIGLEKVATTVQQQKLKKVNWGVILDIDETVLDNSLYQKRNLETCSSYSTKSNYEFMEEKISTATPGAVNFTCAIHKLGGKVVLVTNRDGTFDDKIQPATIANLKSADICFDNVVFAKGSQDKDKTPRFEAVIHGDYSKIVAVARLKPLQILAYFGDNIQDFPNIQQSKAIEENPNGDFYKKFGQIYFSLPNPIYGSWQSNQFN